MPESSISKLNMPSLSSREAFVLGYSCGVGFALGKYLGIKKVRIVPILHRTFSDFLDLPRSFDVREVEGQEIPAGICWESANCSGERWFVGTIDSRTDVAYSVKAKAEPPRDTPPMSEGRIRCYSMKGLRFVDRQVFDHLFPGLGVKERDYLRFPRDARDAAWATIWSEKERVPDSYFGKRPRPPGVIVTAGAKPTLNLRTLLVNLVSDEFLHARYWEGVSLGLILELAKGFELHLREHCSGDALIEPEMHSDDEEPYEILIDVDEWMSSLAQEDPDDYSKNILAIDDDVFIPRVLGELSRIIGSPILDDDTARNIKSNLSHVLDSIDESVSDAASQPINDLVYLTELRTHVRYAVSYFLGRLKSMDGSTDRNYLSVGGNQILRPDLTRGPLSHPAFRMVRDEFATMQADMKRIELQDSPDVLIRRWAGPLEVVIKFVFSEEWRAFTAQEKSPQKKHASYSSFLSKMVREKDSRSRQVRLTFLGAKYIHDAFRNDSEHGVDEDIFAGIDSFFPQDAANVFYVMLSIQVHIEKHLRDHHKIT